MRGPPISGELTPLHHHAGNYTTEFNVVDRHHHVGVGDPLISPS
jgi:hypothetical protein